MTGSRNVWTVSPSICDNAAASQGRLQLAPGEGIAGWVGQHGLVASVADAYADPRFSPRSDELLGFRTATLLALPMHVQDQVIGVLELVNKRGGHVHCQRPGGGRDASLRSRPGHRQGAPLCQPERTHHRVAGPQ